MNNNISDKKTLVLGASLKSWKYSHKAVLHLRSRGYEVVAIGNKAGQINDVEISTFKQQYSDIHTITVYLSAQNQFMYYDYMLSLHPQRIIFNPGAENPGFEKTATKNGIHVENACTLVLLAIGGY